MYNVGAKQSKKKSAFLSLFISLFILSTRKQQVWPDPDEVVGLWSPAGGGWAVKTHLETTGGLGLMERLVKSVMVLSLVPNMVINSLPAALVEGKQMPTMEKPQGFSS